MYVVGGRWGNSAGQLQVYNWDTNTWAILAPFNSTTGIWPAGALSCGFINGKIVIAGGEQPGGFIAYPYTAVYDIASNTWDNSHPDMPLAVHHTAFIVYKDELWILGGRPDGMNGKLGSSQTQIYNPVTRVWRTSITDASIPHYPYPVAGTGPAVNYGGEFFIFGGGCMNSQYTNANNIFPYSRILNPETGVWRYGPNMLTPREAICPVLYAEKSKIYVVTSSRAMAWDFTAFNEALVLDALPGGAASGNPTETGANKPATVHTNNKSAAVPMVANVFSVMFSLLFIIVLVL